MLLGSMRNPQPLPIPPPPLMQEQSQNYFRIYIFRFLYLSYRKYAFGLATMSCVCVATFFFRRVFLWIYVTLVGLVHRSQDSQTSFFNNFFIKNGSHDTIHTFENYFATIISIFNFQQNKRHPNESEIG